MKNTHRILNVILVAMSALFITSCSTTGQLAGVPPITFKGNVKGQDVSVTVYPDGSKPAEVVVGDGGPIVIDVN